MVLVLLELRPLIEDLAVLDRERMKRELLAQALQTLLLAAKLHPAQRLLVESRDIFYILPDSELAVRPQLDNTKHGANIGADARGASIAAPRCMRQPGSTAVAK